MLEIGEASDNEKAEHVLYKKLERTNWRAFHTLLMVHGFSIRCTRFEPRNLRKRLEFSMANKCIPVCTLLAAGRIEITQTDPSFDKTASDTHTKKRNYERAVNNRS